jgi:hypothetical protein
MDQWQASRRKNFFGSVIVDPALVFFGIKALVRVGQQANKALIDHAADQNAVFPDIEQYSPENELAGLNDFLDQPRYASLRTGPIFGDIWDPNERRIDPDKWDELPPEEQQRRRSQARGEARDDESALALLDHEARRSPLDERGMGFAVVAQWKPEAQPITPLGRLALVVAEIALDYVSVNPQLIGVRGSGGEKVLKAFATAIASPLTERLDADSLGPASAFYESALQTLVGAAFDAFTSNLKEVVSEEHLANLLGNVLDPIVTEVKAKEDDVPFQRRMQKITDTLLGPAAAAAMKTIADDPAAFFGGDFAKSKAAGALVGALLVEAAKNPDVRQTFSDQGLLALVTAALEVAAQKPGLFVRTGKNDTDTLLKDVVGSVAAALKQPVQQLRTTGAFDARRVAAALAAAAIEAVGKNSGALFDAGKWDAAAAELTKKVLGGLAAALQDPVQKDALRKVFSEEQLIELGRIVINNIAASPRIVGLPDEMTTLVVAIAKAAAADKNLLLSGEDWLEIVKLAGSEAAANPARLLGAKYNTAQHQLFADLIKLILKQVPDPLPKEVGPAIIKGETLREAMSILIKYFAGAPDNAKTYLPLLEVVMKNASNLVAANAGGYGSKEWLRLLRVLCAGILAGKYSGQLGQLNAGQPITLLTTRQEFDALLGAGGA